MNSKDFRNKGDNDTIEGLKVLNSNFELGTAKSF